MASPSTNLVPSALSITWWPPTPGILLAVLGVLLLAPGMREPVPPVMPDYPPTRHWTAREVGRALVPPSGPPQGGAVRAWGRDHVTAEALGLSNPGMPRPADCLGADLATGRRAESAHLATVPLPGPGECGDLRDAVMELATLRYGASSGMRSGRCLMPPVACHDPGHANSDDRIATALFAPALPQSRLASGAEEREPTSINLRAAALFGPPDWQLVGMLAAELLGSERGDARRYLERSATGKWLVESFRRIMDWNAMSGYGAVETQRAEASLEASQATSPDSLPAALASGRRAASAHLATIPLPGEGEIPSDTVSVNMVVDRL